MTVPGMPKAIFLEDIVVRDAAFDALAEVSDSQRGNNTWRCMMAERRRLSMPSLERGGVQIKPLSNGGRIYLVIPREEIVDFLNLDDGKLLILKTSRLICEGNKSVIL